MSPHAPVSAVAARSHTSPRWLRNLVWLVLIVLLLLEICAGASYMLMVHRLRDRVLLELPKADRQVALLAGFTPLASSLQNLALQLPREAKVFIINAKLEDYYLANYLLFPRRVLVDTPGVPINGEQGDPVGRNLPTSELRALGITHVLIVDRDRDQMRLVTLENDGDARTD